MTFPGCLASIGGKRFAGKAFMLLALCLIVTAVYLLINAEKTVYLTVDGKKTQLTTKAETVGEVLAASGIYPGAYDILIPAADTKVEKEMEIYLKRAFPVYLKVDQQLRLVYTTAENVADFLAAEQVHLSAMDRVYPQLTSTLKRNDTVEVIRVTTKLVEEEYPLDFKTITKKDPTLPLGKKRVEVEGEKGVLVKTYQVVLANGQEESRELVEEKCVREPINRVVAIGTKQDPVVTVSARGGRRVYEGIASWISNKFHGKKTAYGDVYNQDAFTCAFPDKALRGKTLRVTYLKTGRSVDVVVNDFGPHVKGRIIDLSAAAARAIGLSGVGRVKVEVLE
ncbi:MAG: septal ring lytic transglycosylase RlpA family protein [Firmicutes bacterium]|nr:septal ring lytic transglycosylase RlpA family protein [Bacillota bacterium]